MSTKPKYKNLTMYHAASVAGEHDGIIILDNDVTDAYEEETDQSFEDHLKQEPLLRGGTPMQLLRSCLDLLGLKHEPA